MKTTVAIIEIAGHQYQISPGATIDIPYQKNLTEGKTTTLNQVLAVIDDQQNLTPGKPYLPNITVKAKVIKHFKGPKTSQINYKAKSRYRRRIGFRPHFTRLEIIQIQTKASQKQRSK